MSFEGHHIYNGRAIYEAHAHLPRIAAHLAILDVLLIAPATRVDTDGDDLTAVRTVYFRRCLGSSIAGRKFIVEIAAIHFERLFAERRLDAREVMPAVPHGVILEYELRRNRRTEAE